MKKQITALLTAISISLPFGAAFVAENIFVTAASSDARQMEYLDRGTVAVKVNNGVYLSWRLLGTENYDTAFDVYRDGELIHTVSDSTNYTDSGGTSASKYTVVSSGTDISSSEAVSVWGKQYLEIPLDRPSGGVSKDGEEYTYSPNDACAADVDGDGQYEIILKWEPSNSFDSGKDAKHNGNVYVDAYSLDGTRIWRIDMGKNINAGAHFTQITAYDLDLDGRAEIAMKTAPGTKDGGGRYVSEASLIDSIKLTDNEADYRDSTAPDGKPTEGRVLDGPEFYTVFDGGTGDALDTIYYPHPRGTIVEWGDNWGNRSERYLTAVAYLDGTRPSVIAWRGYYEKTTAAAFDLINKRLVQIADFDTSTSGFERYAGNGNHNLTVGDVDNDGKDEIICGSLALDDDFSVLWCSGRGHGDALHLADYDPTHDGMEYMSVHEEYSGNEISGSTTGNDGKQRLGGMTVYKAENGEELFHKDSGSDTGRGMMARMSDDGYFDVWGEGTYYTVGSGLFYERKSGYDSTNFRVFWTDNVYDELLDGTGSEGRSFKISSKDSRVQTLDGTATNNSTKCNPCLTADILGDWREEILVRSADNLSLRLYTTTIQTPHKLYTLMHDSAYRMQTVCQNAGYNQPPHIGYYINEENDKYDMRKFSSYVKTVHNGETAVRTENLPDDKPIETVPPATPIPTPDPETYYKIDENGTITKYSGSETIVNIPDTINGITVTGIGSKAFYGNMTVSSLKMPDTVTHIDEMAFYFSYIGDITLSPNLKSIGARAFTQTELAGIDIPDGVTVIEEETFYMCGKLRWVDLPSSLTSIGSKAFYDTALDEIRLPSNLKEIGGAAFRESNITEIIIPEGVTKIGSGAFMNCKNLENVKLNEGLTSVDGRVFYGCEKLGEIELPDTVTSLGEGMFKNCVSLTSLTIPEGITVIPKEFAMGCSSLKNAELPQSVTEIGSNAFAGCVALEKITILPQVTIIDSNAFSDMADGFTIYGYTNSQAYKYAKKNSINFVAIGYMDRVIPTLPPMPTCAPEDSVQITTNDATEITQTSAVLNGSITNSYFLDYYYIATDNEDDETLHQTRSYSDRPKADRAAWFVEVDDLRPSTTYIFYAFNYGTQTRGEIKSFTTLAAPEPTEPPVPTEAPTPEPTGTPEPTDPPDPTVAPLSNVTTKAATDITATTATLNGDLELYNPTVSSTMYYRFWAEGDTETKYVYAQKDSDPPYQGYIKGLKPNTVYYYYAYTNTGQGETLSFKTLSDAAPSPEPTDNYPYKIASADISDKTVTLGIEKSDNALSARIIFAEYDGDTLKRVQVESVSSDEKGNFTRTFEYSGGDYKAFVWDALDTMTPLAESLEYKK